jgi:hypothetical protein
MTYKILINLTIYMLFISIGRAKCIKDVPQALLKLSKSKPKAEKLYINDSIDYTLNPLNFFGIHNHFQGVYKTSKKIFITGGNKKNHTAEVFIFEKDEDKFKYKKTLTLNEDDSRHWHAGSFQMTDNELIIPIERLSDPLTSKIVRLDLKTNSLQDILSINYNKTGAIDLFTHKGIEYIVLFDPKEISLYKYNDLTLVKRINVEFFTGSGAKVLKDCNENIYFANITNNGLFPPIINYKNIIQLSSFSLESFSLEKPQIFEFKDNESNFRGAANIIKTDSSLEVIATSMYKSLISKEIIVEYFTASI